MTMHPVVVSIINLLGLKFDPSNCKAALQVFKPLMEKITWLSCTVVVRKELCNHPDVISRQFARTQLNLSNCYVGLQAGVYEGLQLGGQLGVGCSVRGASHPCCCCCPGMRQVC